MPSTRSTASHSSSSRSPRHSSRARVHGSASSPPSRSRSGGNSRRSHSHRAVKAEEREEDDEDTDRRGRDNEQHDDEDDDDEGRTAAGSSSSGRGKRKRKSTAVKREKKRLQVHVDDVAAQQQPSAPSSAAGQDAVRAVEAYGGMFDHPSTPARVPHPGQPSPASALFSSSYLTGLQSSPFWSTMSPQAQTGGLPVPAAQSGSAAASSSSSSAASSALSSFRAPLTPMPMTPSSLDVLSPSAHFQFSADESTPAAMPLSTPQVYKSPQKFTFVTPTTSQLTGPRQQHPPQQQDSAAGPIHSSCSSAASSSSSTSQASSASIASASGSKRPSYIQRLDFSTPDTSAEKRKDKTAAGGAGAAGGDGGADGNHLRPQGLPLLSPGSFASPASARFYNGGDLLSPFHHALSALSPFVPPSRLDTSGSSSSSSSSSSSATTPAASLGRPSSPSLFSPAPSSHHHHTSFPFSPMFPASPSASGLLLSPASGYPSPSALNAGSGGSPMVYPQSFLSLPTPASSAMLLQSPSSGAALLSPASFTSSPSSFSSHSQSSSSSSSSSLNTSPLHPSAQHAAGGGGGSNNSNSPLLSSTPLAASSKPTAMQSNIPLAAHHYLSSLLPSMSLPPLPLTAASGASSSASSAGGLAAAVAPSLSGVSSKACNCKKSRCLKLYCECFARGELCRECNCIGCENTGHEEHRQKREKAIGQVMERDRNGFYRSAAALKPDAKQLVGMATAGGAAAGAAGGRVLMNNMMMKMMLNAAMSKAHQQAAGSSSSSVSSSSSSLSVGAKSGGGLSSLLPLPLLLPHTPFLSLSHPKGCHCKKSECQKKYCECYQAGMRCSDICRCIQCKNGKDNDHTAAALPVGLALPSAVAASTARPNAPTQDKTIGRRRGRKTAATAATATVVFGLHEAAGGTSATDDSSGSAPGQVKVEPQQPISVS